MAISRMALRRERLPIVGVGVGDFLCGKVRRCSSTTTPRIVHGDGLGYVHSIRFLEATFAPSYEMGVQHAAPLQKQFTLGVYCNEASAGRRIVPCGGSSGRRHVGEALGTMMEVRQFIEL